MASERRLRWTVRCASRAAIAAVMLVCSSAALGQEPASDEVRSAARALAREGDSLWDQADYATALDRFARAFELVKAPTLAVRQAECLVRLGRWVEASERYLAVSKVTLGDDAPEPYRAAVQQARSDREALLARMPRLTLRIASPAPPELRVTVDERVIPRALWGAPFPLDPGKHPLTARTAAGTSTREVLLREGQSESIAIELPRAPSPAPPGVVGERPDPSRRTWGWIAMGAGAAGLATAGISFAVASNQRQTLDDAGCEDGHCAASLGPEVDSYNRWRMVSTISLAAGVLGVGTGAALLLSAAGARTQRGVTGWVGFGTVGAAGAF